MLQTGKSRELFDQARKVIPGGVNSPVRAFSAVGGQPVYFKKGQGPWLWDVDGNRYLDFVGSWGPMIAGHSHPRVVEALRETVAGGTSFGACVETEVELARLITRMVPSVEMVRMVNSGTEATMSAIRLARGHTGRDKIIKFSGCYHGHADSFLIEAGSGATTLGVPNSPGIPGAVAADTLNAVYNDIESVKRLIEKHRGEIAALIIEPVAGNMGVIPAEENFLRELRRLTGEEGIVLIFDEVMSGFRVAPGGAQQLYGIRPDLTTMGKIIGGGLPVGAYGGKRELMERIAPSGDIYQAGTLSGNPLAMRAGLETLRLLNEPGFYDKLEEKSAMLEEGLRENMRRLGVGYHMSRVGSMGCFFFIEQTVTNYNEAGKCDTAAFARYFRALLEQGVYVAPSQFEAYFVSAAHGDDEMALMIKAHQKALAASLEKK
ncbi:MAG TPA: glutamate-1-semialdehyde-2,1-aminomutase [Caldithrix abyssi]|uniref:Glutamate-1-semialdehyde 2,1-aminomutase n=1 Tax=Caldithrix abyssi TaxID=187145 RepID=A0A7V5VET7_CALAY|nr:glutamate-1-semialdehyde-2,1-aminomutase [Caldithrix abyssi]